MDSKGERERGMNEAFEEELLYIISHHEAKALAVMGGIRDGNFLF